MDVAGDAGDRPVDRATMRDMTSPQTPLRTAPVEVLEERPDATIDDGDREKMSHIIRKDDEMKGYALGEEVEALCGKRWVPTRDPQKFPVCPTCLEVLGHIRAAGAN